MTATTGPSFGFERFSDGRERRVAVDPLTSFSVLRLRRHFDPQTYIGGIFTNVTRLGGASEAFSGGVDYNILVRKRLRHNAQVIGTHDGQKAGVGAGTTTRWSGKRASVWKLSCCRVTVPILVCGCLIRSRSIICRSRARRAPRAAPRSERW